MANSSAVYIDVESYKEPRGVVCVKTTAHPTQFSDLELTIYTGTVSEWERECDKK